jgi:hypothetical protein
MPYILELYGGGVTMPKAARHFAKREPFTLYRRIEAKLGIGPLQSDGDLGRLVDEGLPLMFGRLAIN